MTGRVVVLLVIASASACNHRAEIVGTVEELCGKNLCALSEVCRAERCVRACDDTTSCASLYRCVEGVCVLSVCGNGVVDVGEACDEGTQNGQAGCTKLCTNAYCGDGLVAANEQCDAGFVPTGVRRPDCRPDCTIPRCGDGVRDEDELCDDGDHDDTNRCTNACTLARCGDGIVAFSEQCDDGGLNDTLLSDACRSSCQLPYCGDGVQDSDEGCDHGNANSDSEPDRCRLDCTLPRCGDGVAERGEECDDGNFRNDDGCLNTCQEARCGDGLVHHDVESCDQGTFNSNILADTCRTDCQLPRCGDGIKDGAEQCDDGNIDPEDACLPSCRRNTCGDGVVNKTGGESTGFTPGERGRIAPSQIEECDDGNESNRDACLNSCRQSDCGDGFVRLGIEECDLGVANALSADRCRPSCALPRCGDGVRDSAEQCDDGNSIDGDACTNACTLARCGDGIRTASEECDHGNANSDSVPGSCRLNCRRARCGDEVVDFGEQCDDGNQNNQDRCRNNCEVAFCGDGSLEIGREQCDDGVHNSGGPSACRPSCERPRCGDAIVDFGEQCDDGDTDDTDGCQNNCQAARCGDGRVQAGELCDDGNADNTDGCPSNCQEARCGDGFVRRDGFEECDQGSANSNALADRCRLDCTRSRCGDGVTDLGEGCDDGNDRNDDDCLTSCRFPSCGDGFVWGGVEPCDDGNASNFDGCRVGCIANICGDGFRSIGIEACDDGAANSDDTADRCRVDCSTPRCGDGVVDTGEPCDDGNGDDADGCRNSCELPTCGDGVVDASEECDLAGSNNNAVVDGCRTTCVLAYCGDGVQDTGESCDDHNRDNTDDCTSACVPASCGDGFVQPPEACDAGPANSDDGEDACRTDCTLPRCGDGVRDANEDCDSGGVDISECRANCRAPRCGDGIIDVNEACDDGNDSDHDDCTALCESAVCGDGHLRVGVEECDDPLGNHDDVADACRTSCVHASCGDGVPDSLEECDDGNVFNDDSCTTACAEAACGDGFVYLGGGESPGLAPGERGRIAPSPYEACDDGDTLDSNGCSNACAEPRCGDGIVQADEPCDDGDEGNTSLPNACRPDCEAPRCGDSVTDADEQCDDGNEDASDGCIGCLQARCGDGRVLAGVEACDEGAMNDDDVPNRCRRDCTLPSCGDGVRDEGELCDDADQDTTDSCVACQPAVCGDGFTRRNVEECDDANSIETDGCHNDCTAGFCGDGLVHLGLEQCDDGNSNNADACPSTCTHASCGDGFVHEGVESCDDGLLHNRDERDACRLDCTLPRHGDRIVDTGEACDDGNDVDGDDCTNASTVAVCGDDIVHAGVEACDDGNQDDQDDCRNNCQQPFCGDGHRRIATEQCDDGGISAALADGCRADCRRARCGDDIIDSNEQCDDGALNANVADACRTDCTAAFCGDSIVDSSEQCDDSNDNENDACLTSCRDAFCGDGHVQLGVEACDDGAGNQSDTVPNACRSDCTPPRCGDDVVDLGEQCDDGVGNGTGPNQCRPVTCQQAGCGDGIVDLGEQCDDGANNSDVRANACRTSCALPACGDDVQDQGEACDDGTANSDDLADTCRTDCRTFSCGDGVQDTGEFCDDGNDDSTDDCVGCHHAICGDGVVFTEEEECDTGSALSDELPDACRVDCTTHRCGDGVPDSDEQCDDENDSNEDACTNACQRAVCGDGFVQAAEECDTADARSNERADACRESCTLARCGDGVPDSNEPCDDGDHDNTDTCTNACALAACGDGFVQGPEQCDSGVSINSDELPNTCRTTCQRPSCGDGVTDAGGESAEFTSAERGRIAPSFDEVCDDGALNANVADACREDCSAPVCGDGIRDAAEGCDDGADNDNRTPDACRLDCQPARCGDGVRDTSELCDDGNQTLGDSCPDGPGGTCQPPRCGDGLRNGSEQCDDGNQINNDTCANICQAPEARCDHVDDDHDGIVDEGCGGVVPPAADTQFVKYPFAYNEDGFIACRGERLIRRSGYTVGRYVGVILCNATEYEILLSEDPTQVFLSIKDGAGSGEDHCEFVGAADGRVIIDGSFDATRLAYFRSSRGETPMRARVTLYQRHLVCATRFVPDCGDGLLDTPDEECDTGLALSDTEPSACRTDCRLARCGDLTIDSNETCDDGNTTSGDGCDANCQPTGCPNGSVTTGEACDDGNQSNDDGCLNTCQRATCGDGFVQAGLEQCDDGNTTSGDGCERCRLAVANLRVPEPLSSIDSIDGVEIYGVADDWDIYRSTNGGASWSRIYTLPASLSVRRGEGFIRVSPANPQMVVVFDNWDRSDGQLELLMTQDGFATVSVRTLNVYHQGTAYVRSLADASNLYFLMNGASFKSTDGGVTLTQLPENPWTGSWWPSGYVHPFTPETFWVADGSNRKLFESRDAGRTKIDITGRVRPALLGQAPTDMLLTIDERGIHMLVISTNGQLAESLDLGQTFSALPSTRDLPGCGERALVGLQSDPRVLATTCLRSSNGTAVSVDRGNTWQSIDTRCNVQGLALTETSLVIACREAPALFVPYRQTTCGDGIVASTVEQCDTAAARSDSEPDACRTNCLFAHCGDETTDTGEACDDGNLVNGDGCDAGCIASACHNGVKAPDEVCDDGNSVNSDACVDECEGARCGDGHVRTGSEHCDDGGTQDGDGCSATCFFEKRRISALPGSIYTMDSADGVTVYAAETSHQFWRSQDGGATWARRGQGPRYDAPRVRVVPGSGEVLVYPNTLTGTLRFIVSRDGLATFDDLSLTASGGGRFGSAVSMVDDTLYVMADAKLLRRHHGEVTRLSGLWNLNDSRNGFVDPRDPDRFWILEQGLFWEGNGGGATRTLINSRIAPVLGGSSPQVFDMFPTASGYVMRVASHSDRIAESLDYGQNFHSTRIGPNTGNCSVRFLVSLPTNRDVLATSCDDTRSIAVSFDGGATMHNVGAQAFSSENYGVSSLVLVPGALLVTASSGNAGPFVVQLGPVRCGDGIPVAGHEECDDGNEIETDGCTTACTRCGNGVVTAPEQCDDNNLVSVDGCTAACILPVCGDGFARQGVEQCDDGNSNDFDGCTNACTLCGNGTVTAPEQCDDSDAESTDFCTPDCRRASCGDGFVYEVNEACDGSPGCSTACTLCGNGVVDPPEACDDGNRQGGDGCSEECTNEPAAIDFGETLGTRQISSFAHGAAGVVYAADRAWNVLRHPAPAPDGQTWQLAFAPVSAGPENTARIVAIPADRSHGLLYADRLGGGTNNSTVFSTTDGWQSATLAVGISSSTTIAAVSNFDVNNVYLFGAGAKRTSDGGATFGLISPSPWPNIWRPASATIGSAELASASGWVTDRGVFWSFSDGGTRRTDVTSRLGLLAGDVPAAHDEVGADLRVLTKEGAIWRSTDLGQTFAMTAQARILSLCTNDRRILRSDPSAPEHIATACLGEHDGLAYSLDEGAHWLVVDGVSWDATACIVSDLLVRNDELLVACVAAAPLRLGL